MCTVTFVPLEEGAYFLTSNRDEHISRPRATLPVKIKHDGYELIFPKDPQGGGTWIASDDRGNTVCLLNGADKPHTPKYPYRHSRGLVVLDYFSYSDFHHFKNSYPLDNIEPFTLVIVSPDQLIEFKWDGQNKTHRNLPRVKAKIWSSVTLYSIDIIKQREIWFQNWLSLHQKPGIPDLIHFHKFTGTGDKRHDVLMEREGGLRTVSITSIHFAESIATIYYEDLENGESVEKTFQDTGISNREKL